MFEADQASTAQESIKAEGATAQPIVNAASAVAPVVPVVDSSKPADTTPAVPEKYELKLPEGSLLDAKSVEGISSFAKEKGLSNEQAQALLEHEHSAVSQYANAQQTQYKTMADGWITESQADPEIGGENLKKNAELGKRVLDRFGTEPLKQLLNESGYGNNKELIRFCYRIGKAMSEDQLVLPGASSESTKSIEEIFYPKKT